MTMQAGMTKVNEIFFHGAVNRTLKEVFPVVAPYQSFISCFGTPWGFILASKGTDPRKQSPDEIDRLIAERMNTKDLAYWDGNAHLHCFSLPKFLRESIEKNDRVITDKNPLIVT
jgi:spermidine synthase